MIPTAASAGDVWQQVTGTQPAPPAGVVLGAGLVAAVLVGWRPSWRLVRGVVTIAHEAGHAAVAALTGRTLMGITLHSDTSGLTVSRGRPTGPGMVATLAAGYVAPSVLGVAAVGLLVAERTTLLLWGTIALLAAVLALIRNVYGALSVVSTGAVVGLLSWYGSPAQQGAFAYFVAWFLLLSAPRPGVALAPARRGVRRGHARAGRAGRAVAPAVGGARRRGARRGRGALTTPTWCAGRPAPRGAGRAPRRRGGRPA